MNSLDHSNSQIQLSMLLDYEDGKLDNATARKVEKQLREDKKMATILKGIRSYYEQHGYDREKLEAWLLSSERRMQETIRKYQPSRHKTVSLFKASIIAASVALLLGISYLFLRTPTLDTPTLVTMYLDSPYPAPELFRDNDAVDRQWIYAYQDENYKNAANDLEALLAKGNSGAELMFYAGLCFLYQEKPDYEQAAHLLQEVTNTGNIYQQSAQWYLALAYYQAGKLENAKELLHKIVQTLGHENQKEAGQLLNTL